MNSFTNLYISDIKMENSRRKNLVIWNQKGIYEILFCTFVQCTFVQCTFVQCTFESEGRYVHASPKDKRDEMYMQVQRM